MSSIMTARNQDLLEAESSCAILIRQVFGLWGGMPSEDKAMRTAVDKALRMLQWREEFVLRHRYGFVDGKIHTYEEVGNLFGVTRTRACQIAAKALRKLRHPSRNQYIKPFRGEPDV